MELRKEIFREYDIRGIYGSELDETTAYLIGKAYGTKLRELNKKDTVVAYDNRLSSEILEENLVNPACTITFSLIILSFFNFSILDNNLSKDLSCVPRVTKIIFYPPFQI